MARSSRDGCGSHAQGLPILSLFSGAGGLDLGFRRAGFIPLLAIDISPAAVRTYQRNHPGTRVEQLDLSETPVEELIALWNTCSNGQPPAGIVGGPPCQAFSVSNVHQKSDDPRARLVERYAEIIATFAQSIGLDFFVFENVPGLLGKRHRARYEAFKEACQAAGFRIFEKTIDAVNFGVPQYRPRVIVVGLNERSLGEASFDIPGGNSDPVPVSSVLAGLPEPEYYRPGLKPEEVPFHPNHVTQRVKSPKFAAGSFQPGQVIGRSFRVLRWDAPSWTVAYGHREVHIHPGCHRRLSVYEAMRLQGFPHEYVLEGTLSQQVTLVSDACPPPVGEALGAAIRAVLRSARARGATSVAAAPRPVRLPRVPEYFFVEWYLQNGRWFPWRERGVTAYGILVAEMLLRQTKAEMVAGCWPLLLDRWPAPRDLSQASEDDIWEVVRGLGLGRQRASALRAVALELVRRFDGEVPGSVEDLMSLPHVGLYTAHAVCVFAYNMRLPVVDNNVIRLFSRLAGVPLNADNRRSPLAWEIAWSLLPGSAAREHSLGLLDFAGMVCTPSRPRCESCPLGTCCLSRPAVPGGPAAKSSRAIAGE